MNAVGPRYFETMGIALSRGREFRWSASSGAVVSLVVTRGMKIVAIGLILGVSASLLLTIPLRAMLIGVSPVDPIAFATTAIVLFAGGACASYLPSLRATRVDPLVTLRQT